MSTIQEIQQSIVNLLRTPSQRTSTEAQVQTDSGISSAIPGYNESIASAEGLDEAAMKDYYDNYNRIYQERMKEAQENPWMHIDEYLPGKHPFTGKTHEETTRLSRLADALNNQYFRRPGAISSVGYGRGGKTIGQGGDAGQLYQAPVETEEMREMQRSRQLELQQRQRELARQQGLMDIPLDQQRMIYQQQLERSGKYNAEQLRRAMELWDWQHGYSVMARQAQFARTQLAFERINIPREQAQILTGLAQANPVLGNLYAQLLGNAAGVPDMKQMAWLNRQAEIAQNTFTSGGGWADVNRRISGEILRMSNEEIQTITGGTLTEVKRWREGLLRSQVEYRQGR